MNYSQIIINTINELLSTFFSSVDNTLYSLLDELLFIKPVLLYSSFLKPIISSNILIYIANSISIGILTYYCFKLLFSTYTAAEIESPYQFIFKLLIFTILANNYSSIIEIILNINSLLSSAIQSIGSVFSNKSVTFATLIERINILNFMENTNSVNFISFSGFIHSFMIFGLLNLLLSFSIRYIMICVFIIISPIAFISLISYSSSWIFKTWLKSLFSLLVTQSFISLLLLLSFAIPTDNSPINFIFYLALLHVLTKSNSYIKELFGGITTEVSNNFSSLKALLTK